MRRSPLFVLAFCCSGSLLAQDNSKLTEVWQPEPNAVTPGKTVTEAPSDATVLFDGTGFSQWENNSRKGEVKWKLEDHAMIVSGNEGVQTKKGFGDCQLHIEWRTPAVIKGDGQERGNSGIFFMGQYELQVLDSYKNRTYSNGQAGSIYKQYIPLVNASRQPGEWQSYDVIFTAPRFKEDSTLESSARATVFHNGILVQNNVSIWGGTQNLGIPSYKMHADKAPLVLQNHGDPVAYRNIWIREL